MSSRSSIPLSHGVSAAAGSLLTAALLATTPTPVIGQQDAPDRPEANPADVKSPDAIVTAAYDAISGPAGERDWDRVRSLFLPEARLIPTDRSEGEPGYDVWSVEELIEVAKERFGDEDFYEQQIHAVTERFGDMAHVFSTYGHFHSPEGEPYHRGINSFQLWYDGDRWWIVTIFWQSEREGAPIPERYGG